jgi:protein-disulfide isomerase
MKSDDSKPRHLYLLILLSLALFACKDERVTMLEARIAKLEEGLKREAKVTATATPELIPTTTATSSPTPANGPISEAIYTLTGDEKDDPFIGKKDASVILMAFFDYQSQASRRFANVTFPELKKDFEGKNRRLILRDYPLPDHDDGVSAAIYAQCAGEQGKYWAAFEKLTTSEDLLKAEGETLVGINTTKFKKCRDSNRYLPEIEKDQRDGQSLGTQGSPSFFLGKCTGSSCRGKFVRGAQPLGVFRKLLQELEE